MIWLKWFGPSIVGLLVLITALFTYSRQRWDGLSAQLFARLDSARTKLQPGRFDTHEVDGLPPPVQRFFRTALSDGMPLVAVASVEQAGTFNIGETSDQWKDFTATQRVVTRHPGFLWDARVAMLPGVAVHVHDAYVQGEGLLHAAIAGLVTVAELRGGDVARGELMRFVAEAALYPTALLPSQGVVWEDVGQHSARATFTDGSISVTMMFTFGMDGLIESIRADERGRLVGEKIIPTPWEGRWTEYRLMDGMRVPMAGEVAWLLPEGRKPYWRGRIRKLRYEFEQ
ncbi:MAG TPA: hypothetical protein PKD12_16705 [Nitrospira sp.]|nr:hypothetical protein [Nitrospira sp.]